MSQPALLRPTDGAIAPDAAILPGGALPAVRSPAIPAIAAIAAATLLSLALRLTGLGDRPFWVDEIGSLAYAQLAPVDLIGKLGRLELTPPLYYLSVRAWLALVGDGEHWLRLPSALIGAAAVPAFAAFLWRAFNPRAAVWGSVLLAVAATHLRYAQEARVYPILFLLFVCGLLLALLLVETQGGKEVERMATSMARRRWVLAALLALVGGMLVHLHFTGVFVLATVHVYALALLAARGQLTPRALLPFAASGAGVLLLLLPILPMALAILGNTQGAAYWLPVPGLQDLWRVLRLVMLAPQLGSLADAVALLSVLALGAALFLCGRDPGAVALAAALLFALTTLFLVSQVTPVLMERITLFVLALYLGLLAAGLSRIRRPSLALAVVAAAALVPQIAGLARHMLRTPSFYGEVWDVAAARILRETEPGEAILVVGAFEAAALDHYLRRQRSDMHTMVAVGDSEDGVNTMVIRLATRAQAIPGPELLRRGVLCDAGLGRASGIRVVTRDIEGLRQPHDDLRHALLDAGAVQRAEARDGNIPTELWSAPRCD